MSHLTPTISLCIKFQTLTVLKTKTIVVHQVWYYVGKGILASAGKSKNF